jgi:hypothetical protein
MPSGKIRLDWKLTQQRAREVFDYDPLTGTLMWRIALRGHPAGRVVGEGATKVRYLVVEVDGEKLRVNRVIWLWMTGSWPITPIDHENLNGRDNTWTNLRLATFSENNANCAVRKHCKTGRKNIRRGRGAQGWQVVIVRDRKVQFTGTFPTLEEAVAARDVAGRKIHGEFYRGD